MVSFLILLLKKEKDEYKRSLISSSVLEFVKLFNPFTMLFKVEVGKAKN
jgi:hypothetical protein